MIQVETAQEVLVRFATARMLRHDHSGNGLEHLPGRKMGLLTSSALPTVSWLAESATPASFSGRPVTTTQPAPRILSYKTSVDWGTALGVRCGAIRLKSSLKIRELLMFQKFLGFLSGACYFVH
ncbi:MAG TPA: hypothetical protein VJV79_34810 [Polyangiaceae bacterium]|nr:hypothetical protein [Polyangiaceae bacterium]